MHLWKVKPERPKDYHCECEYCKIFRGVILNKDNSMINCRRRIGYHWLERSHIAKTPFPIAAWAINEFTKPKDWVVDLTIGVGTTGVEAKKQGRNIEGIELNYNWARIAALSCQQHKGQHSIHVGDVRDWEQLLSKYPYQLIVNNPPYSGDQHASIKTDEDGFVIDRNYHDYNSDKRNLAFMRENETYYKLLGKIYNGIGALYLKSGGYLVIGVKDMVRNKQPYLIHRHINKVIDIEIYSFQGVWVLPHYPRTLFMNTYPKRFPEVKIPLYQTISVWRKR
ncbi:MAG: DNA methyltransferase [Candidatus Heimdallarchaeaceae archaeon]